MLVSVVWKQTYYYKLREHGACPTILLIQGSCTVPYRTSCSQGVCDDLARSQLPACMHAYACTMQCWSSPLHACLYHGCMHADAGNLARSVKHGLVAFFSSVDTLLASYLLLDQSYNIIYINIYTDNTYGIQHAQYIYMLAHSEMSMMKQSTATKIQRSSFHWVPLQWGWGHTFDCGMRWHFCQMMGPTGAHACMTHMLCMKAIYMYTLCYSNQWLHCPQQLLYNFVEQMEKSEHCTSTIIHIYA